MILRILLNGTEVPGGNAVKLQSYNTEFTKRGKVRFAKGSLLPQYIEIGKPPESGFAAGKRLSGEQQVFVRDTEYTARFFTDGSTELVRYDLASRRWVFLFFKGTESGEEREAV